MSLQEAFEALYVTLEQLRDFHQGECNKFVRSRILFAEHSARVEAYRMALSYARDVYDKFAETEKEVCQKDDYNECYKLARQRMEIVQRVCNLPYIKQTRDTDEGQIRFIAKDDVITVIHNVQNLKRRIIDPKTTIVCTEEPPE